MASDCKDGGDHCWHDTGLMFACDPPKYQQICCFCTALREVGPPIKVPVPGHGPHVPGASAGQV